MADLTPPPAAGPGDWGVTWGTLISPPASITDPAHQQLILAASITACWYLTGKQFGRHSTGPLRPCLQCRHGRGGRCGCHYYDRIDLDPSGGAGPGPQDAPVIAINSVKVAGVELDPATDYGIANWRWLDRTPSGTRWPACQDHGADVPPLELDWDYGVVPDENLTLSGVGVLVTQLAKAVKHEPCDLDPSVVQAVQREGISFVLVNPGKAWEKGYTGNSVVDAACTRAWPLGPAVTQAPGFFDPANPGPAFLNWQRAQAATPDP